MPKVTLETLSNLQNESSVVATINANMALIAAALEEALYRAGTGLSTTDNAMEDDLDMNAQRILNLPEPVDNQEPARLGDLGDYLARSETAADNAEASETAASASATAAAASKTAAETAEDNAQDILDEVNSLGVNSGAYTPVSLGTVSSGTLQPEPEDGSMQTFTNGGAFTLQAPTGTGWYRLTYINSASAGAITTNSFDVVFDADENLNNVTEDSIVELLVTNDGLAITLQVTLLVNTAE